MRPSTSHPLFRVAVATIFGALVWIPTVHADDWESDVNGQRAYDKVRAILEYKKAQAEEVEAIFSGLRDTLYVVSPTSRAYYDNNYLTPKSVSYTVMVTAKYDFQQRDALYRSLQGSRYLKKGDHQVQLKFPKGTLTIHLYDEIKPTFDRLVRGGYAFEARAVLLDNEQTVLARSDNSLLLSTPKLRGGGLDFSGQPLLQTYLQAKAPDIAGLVNETGRQSDRYKTLRSYLDQPVFLLTDASAVHFYSLQLEELKNVVSCRILRDSDELLVYKRDSK